MTLKIIRPAYTTVKAAAAMLTSSNVPENDHAEWNAGTTYALGDRCIIAAEHSIYESQVASNLNNPPLANLAGETPKWMRVSATNRTKMFDVEANTITSRAELIDVTLSPGLADSLHLAELDAATVHVTQEHGGQTVFDKTFDLTLNNVFDWPDFFFEPPIRKTSLTVTGLLPFYSGSTVRVRINAPGGTAKCGALAIGTSRFIGDVQWEPRIRQVNYSTKEADKFGALTLLKRLSVNQISVELLVDNSMISEIARLMKAYDAVPLVFAYEPGETGEFECLNVLGIIRDFEAVIQSPAGSFCNLDVLGIL